MKLILDNRESNLIDIINKNYKLNEVILEIKQLAIGDIEIYDENNNLLLIFERKSIKDLASSISDGRYNEQSFRLDSLNIHNHNICYIIEGNLKKYIPYNSRINKSALYSSIFTLSYFKGFTIYRTDDIDETAELIIRICDKLMRENKSKNKMAYYNNSYTNTDINKNDLEIKDNYIDTIKCEKKSFINKDNICSVMLMQIPYVSSSSAKTISNKYKTILNLICELQENPNCLNDILLETKSGKNRKLSKHCISNIKNFLLYEV